MSSKLIGPIILVLMFGWASVSLAQEFDPGADPSLIGWWQCDEGEGNLVSDSSGNGNDGTFVNGAPAWTEGVFGTAIRLVGPTLVEIPSMDLLLTEATMAGWFLPNGTQSDWASIIMHRGGSAHGFNLLADGRLAYHWNDAQNTWSYRGDAYYAADEWTHCAVTIESDKATFYVNGKWASVNSVAHTEATWENPIFLGGDGDSGRVARRMDGSLDEVMFFSRALTAAEVKSLVPAKLKAYKPIPEDGTIGITTPLLQWTAGETAQFHDVYLGTTPDLTEADRVASQQPYAMHYHVLGFQEGTVYYWRVDEIEPGGIVHTGDVWSFSVAPATAWAPVPLDGALYEDVDVDLAWTAGKDAASHDVYFSASEEDVVNGADAALQGNQMETTFDPGPLERGTVYYWRVDEAQSGGAKSAGEVWSFRTIPAIAIEDPDLVGWWKLDEGQGMLAVDWSGYDNHGELMGEPQWVGGFQGEALEFDGVDDYVDTGFAEDLPEWTLSCWVTSPAAPAATAATGPIHRESNGQINWNHANDVFRGGAGVNVDGTWYGAGLGTLLAGTWYHVAATYDGQDLKAYRNGELITTTPCPGTPAAETNTLKLARHAAAANVFTGAVDDARIYSRALTLEEIQLAMRGDTKLAWNPQPASGAVVDIRNIASASWSAGDTAAQHDVYLGTDRDAVRGADTGSPEYMGRQAATSYAVAGLVEFGGGDYFWRIDEVEADGTVRTGSAWKLTVPDYLLIDDFESYTNDVGNRVFQTWVDGIGFNEPAPGNPGNGTGALGGHDVWDSTSPHYQGQIMEISDVQVGRQAMPLYFNNSATPYKSETERTWTVAQDLTAAGVTDLSVWFKGNPSAYVQTSADSFTMSASGRDIWDAADDFRFAYKSLNGDGSIIARVDSIVNTNAWAKGGVMIREGLDAGAKHAMVVVSPGNGVQFTWRHLVNMDMTQHTTQSGLQAPYWVKLTRTGNVFKAEHSADGVTWEPVVDADSNTHEMTMFGSVHIGLALTSHNVGAVTIAEFSNVQTSGGVSGQWQVEAIGGIHPANGEADVYVAVEDTAGRIADVPYPGGANVTDWTEWKIPLSEFIDAGVNMAAVRKMIIGVGNRTAPVADGDGMILIDDITVVAPVPVEDPNEG